MIITIKEFQTKPKAPKKYHPLSLACMLELRVGIIMCTMDMFPLLLNPTIIGLSTSNSVPDL